MTEILSYELDGRSYRLIADGKVAQCLRRGLPYEHRLLKHIHACGFEGTAVDAGAHIGNHSIFLAVICGLDVVAFEPQDSVDTLRQNVMLNELKDRVRVEEVALGTKEGEAHPVGKGELALGAGNTTYPVRTLDSYDLDDVALIKADVEGMEAQVLAGGRDTIRRCRPVIFTESWGDRYHGQVARELAPLGYRMTRRIKTSTPVERWDPC